jgi:AcrR family transcriptional regulator
MTEPKRKRRTRERVLETSLVLFNQFGEPNVTTTNIAEEMNISPGNLYYHFRNKDEIVNDIFALFRREIDAILAAPGSKQATVEDVWLFLHLLFETIWKYRFLYRDLNDLLTRNRTLEIHFKSILAEKVRAIGTLCEGLIAAGEMDGEALDAAALATNMTLVVTYWLSFAYARDPRHFEAATVVGQGAYQTLSLFAPFLRGTGRELFQRLATEYLKR